MRQYQFQGIHCENFAERLEAKLRALEHGEEVVLDYDGGVLYLPDGLDREKVRKILIQESVTAFQLKPKPSTPVPPLDPHHGSHTHKDHTMRNISVVFYLNLLFSFFEVIFGLLFNSMAILSDAVHDFGDSLSVGLSWYFQKISKKEASNRYSFGYERFSLLGALITAVILLLGSILLLTRSIPRVFRPEPVDAQGMFLLALVAIALNGYATWRLSKGTSMNERVLNLHMLEDVLGWVGVLLVSVIVRFTGWMILDPLLSVALSLFIILRTLPLFLSTLHIFLEGVPKEVDLSRVEADILAIPQVHALGHLHVWSIDGEENAMTATVFTTTTEPQEIEELKDKIRKLGHELRVSHSTIEVVTDIDKTIQATP